MTFNQYSKIDGSYKKIEEKTIAKCKENNVDFFNYLGVFIRYNMFEYIRDKQRISLITSLDFRNKIKTRAVLNKKIISNKSQELKEAIKKFEESRKTLFDWLDKTKDPFFFIFNPVYEYKSGLRFSRNIHPLYGCKKIYWTGSSNTGIAADYCNYLVNEKNK